MRTPFTYGLPGDVSYTPQNRIKELYYGNAPDARMEKTMRAVPSGHHMAPIGKNVGMAGRGMGALVAVPFQDVTGRPVMRAAYEAHRLGIGTPLQMAALGDAVADRAACLATTGAMVGGAGVAQQMNQQSAGAGNTPDQGWTTGINIFSTLATVGNQMCNLIQTSGQVTPAAAGATPPPLPAATSALPPSTATQRPSTAIVGSAADGVFAGVPNWAILAGAAVVGGLVASVAFAPRKA